MFFGPCTWHLAFRTWPIQISAAKCQVLNAKCRVDRRVAFRFGLTAYRCFSVAPAGVAEPKRRGWPKLVARAKTPRAECRSRTPGFAAAFLPYVRASAE